MRRCGVEPVVRRVRVGVSTNGGMDYASWARVPFPTKNERLVKKKAVEGASEGVSWT